MIFVPFQGEQVVFDFFTNEAQVSKLIGFLSLEERKGKDKFDSKRFVLFKVSMENHKSTKFISFQFKFIY